VREAATKTARKLLPSKWLERFRADTRDRHYLGAADFFEVAYGRCPDDAERARLRALIPDGRIRRSAHAHRVLMAFDAQLYPTAFAVRATKDSIVNVDLSDFNLCLDADDPSVSAVIADRGDWEPHIARVLADTLEPGSTFVDVGANVGYHSFLAASIVGRTGSVLAIEASPENCRLLELSRLENDWDQVRVLPVALDREPGLRYLTAHLGTNAGFVPEQRSGLLDGHGFVVHATTLDDIAPERIDVMKVDVEGAEFRVLEGGWSTIRRDKPTIVMEFSCEMSKRVSGVEPGAALTRVLELGYELSVLDKESGTAVSVASAEQLLATWNDPLRIEDLLLTPR
jgi:FkbM family methyltransferase